MSLMVVLFVATVEKKQIYRKYGYIVARDTYEQELIDCSRRVQKLWTLAFGIGGPGDQDTCEKCVSDGGDIKL